MSRILIVEDDRELRNAVVRVLRVNGYKVETAESIREFYESPLSQFDAILLDVTLPDGDSRRYIRELRKKFDVPIIFLTARSTETDMIMGFDAGADDYIIKPFSIPLLLRRLKAVLLRSGKEPGKEYRAGELFYDFLSKELSIKGKSIALSKTETKLLEIFLQNRNQVLTTELLLERIWDIDGNFVDKNTLSVTVARLRAKIEEDRKHPRWIRNVFGIGYKWTDKEE